jgi:2-dehydro-3-deoxyphosphogluconate aldolase / (4S)-4-hydroxy-2-oxoglutarate aldolase
MSNLGTFRTITETGLIPVVRAPNAEVALKAVDAIYLGGIRVAEITMTIPGAMRVMERLADSYDDRIVLGAGTVYDEETAHACILAGAAFIVAPSLNLPLIRLANRYSKVIIPGALTPTEVITAWEAGADAVKIFPCGAVGGPKYIRALRGPLPQVELVPTGGVTLETAADFLKAGACAVGVGSELVDTRKLNEEGSQSLVERARKFLDVIKRARDEAPKG